MGSAPRAGSVIRTKNASNALRTPNLKDGQYSRRLSRRHASEQVESKRAASRLRKLQLSPVAQKLANGLQNAMPSWSRLPSEQSRFLDYRDLL